MSAALAYLEDDLPMPRRARHLYLIAVDGRITEHADRDVASNGNVSYKPDPIETVLFTDGLKRVLQTKKDASVADTSGSVPQNKMIVSGRVAMDALGRSIAQYYPTASLKGGSDFSFLKAVDDSADPTVTEYDVVLSALSASSFASASHDFFPFFPPIDRVRLD